MPTQTFQYPAEPPLECDVVMKGGITSGVIYPLALCELAETYRFRAIGGTSAGAIGAAVGAAAEYGRTTGGGFAVLERMPAWLAAKPRIGRRFGARSNLFSLFQPQPDSAPLFRLATAGLGRKGASRVVSMTFAAVTTFWLGALVGALPGTAVVVASATSTGPARIVGTAGGVVLGLLGITIGVLVGLLRRVGGGAVRNNYGICNGMPGDTGSRYRLPALTPWLYETIQEAAGLPADEPLTFGHLQAGSDRTGTRRNPALSLAIMTTNLSQGRPQRLPWPEDSFFYDSAEFRRYFPASVVDWMDAHPPATPSVVDLASDLPPVVHRTAAEERQRLALTLAQHPGLRPFPDAGNVPVIVAARMSLSFPVLLSAVRLWTVDYDIKANEQARDAHAAWRHENPDPTPDEVAQAAPYVPSLEFDEVWFSDGGICSNFPVHFFDRPLARRPTFAMNLSGFPRGQESSDDEAANVYLPSNNAGGMSWRWRHVGGPGALGLAAFVHSIVETATGWVDEISLGMPGYRDRIVNVYHSKSEGGLNLDMDDGAVEKLSERGREAAVKLVKRFAGPTPGDAPSKGWENHRWVRFRTATAGLQDWLDGYRERYVEPATSYQHAYSDYVGTKATVTPPSYPWTGEGQRDSANKQVEALITLSENWGTDTVDFGRATPAPRPRMRLTRET